MLALTYHHQVPELPRTDGLRQAWARNWQQLGWQTRELGLREAAAHPRYESFVAKARTWPTNNPPAYEEACWVRWLALDAFLQDNDLPGAVMADYDVFNVTCRSEMLEGRLELPAQPLVTLGGDQSYVGAIYVSREFARLIPAILEACALRCCLLFHNRQHVSDMIVFKHLFDEVRLGTSLGWLQEYEPRCREELLSRATKGEPWLLHLSTHQMNAFGLDKTMLFLELEKMLWP